VKYFNPQEPVCIMIAGVFITKTSVW